MDTFLDDGRIALFASAGARVSGRRLPDLGDVTAMEFNGVRVPDTAQ